jgi:protein SCO1/2
MPVGSAWLGAVLGCIFALSAIPVERASAHELAVQGLVLNVDRAGGTVVVRYEQAAGLPSRTQSLAVIPRSRLKQLNAGASIRATLDEDAHPPALRDVRVVGRESLTGTSAAVSTALIVRNVARVTVGEEVPAGAFVDQTGRAFTLAALRGNPFVLAFVYTRCRDARMCPLISAKFAQLQSRTGDRNLHLVEVSLDPAYDTPAVLARYGRQYGADPARWKLLTGDPESVLNFAARFDVTAFPDPRVGLIHSERTVLVDKSGTIRQLIDETAWLPDELVAAVRADERLASNPIARLNLWLSSAAVAICGNAVAGFSGFTDLFVVLAIFGFFGWLLYRIGRAIYRSAA